MSSILSQTCLPYNPIEPPSPFFLSQQQQHQQLFKSCRPHPPPQPLNQKENSPPPTPSPSALSSPTSTPTLPTTTTTPRASPLSSIPNPKPSLISPISPLQKNFRTRETKPLLPEEKTNPLKQEEELEERNFIRQKLSGMQWGM